MTWVLLIGMTLLGAVGGLLFKRVSGVTELRQKLYFFVGGCAAYGCGAILNVVALHYLPYTVVFPLTSFTYIWTFIFSYFILHEKINRYKLLGLLFILIGAYIIVQ